MTNTKLIAELRHRVRNMAKHLPDPDAPTLTSRAADALEAAEQRITELEAETERAVIEKASGHLRVIEGADADILHGRPVMDAGEEKALALRLLGEVLAKANTDAALRERDAALLDRLIEKTYPIINAETGIHGRGITDVEIGQEKLR